jgi:outer membrane receptor protein involved in Fe transport
MVGDHLPAAPRVFCLINRNVAARVLGRFGEEGLALSATTAPLGAERTKSFELGSKWRFGKLMVSGALFRTTLYNVRERSPIDPTILILVGTARVDGLELIFAGDPLAVTCPAPAKSFVGRLAA